MPSLKNVFYLIIYATDLTLQCFCIVAIVLRIKSCELSEFLGCFCFGHVTHQTSL